MRHTFNRLTVTQLRDEIARRRGKAPAGTRKDGLVTILCLLVRPTAIRDNYLNQKQYGGVHTLTPRQNRRIRKAKNRARKVSK